MVMVRMNICPFEMSEAITIWISNINIFQKHGFRDTRKKKLNFRDRSLVQFKVRMNIWLFKTSKAITGWILNKNTFQKRGYRESWQNSWI
jgi:hypothetical protein